MKKVGIVTIYDLNNYGNRLQNYALNFVLKNEGLSVVNLKYKNIGKRNIAKIILLPFLKGERKLNTIRLCKFLRFQKYLRTILYSEKDVYEDYSFLFVGSDQVWHPKWYGNSYMFLNFVPPQKRISYSASFGLSEIPRDRIEYFKTNLIQMKHISVREESGARLIEELTGRKVPVLIDPTLMLNQNEWCRVSRKPKIHIQRKYILTYFLGEVSDDRNRFLQKVANDNNYEIIRLEMYNQTNAWFKTGPSEFIWLIEHGELICTDSFHATVFSILMKVPFIVFNREDNFGDMSSRIDSLLSKFHLEERKFINISENNIFKNDYQQIYDILQIERQKSIDFLRSALSE